MRMLLKAVCAVVCALFANDTDAQQFKRLFVGDPVELESIVFSNTRNYPGGKKKLSDFKGKIIILDFWSKGCTACIQAFPKMEELQEKFKNDLQVLLVTPNKEEELAQLFRSSRYVKETRLPMIIGDSILSKVNFPHSAVPHHVWIDKEGRVAAVPIFSETTSENIRKLIDGQRPDVSERKEILDKELIRKINDEKTSLLGLEHPWMGGDFIYYSIPNLPKKGNAVPAWKTNSFDLKENPYYSFFRTYLHEVSARAGGRIEGDLFLDEKDSARGLKLINYGLLNLYQNAFGGIECKKIIADGNARLLIEEITDTTNLQRHLKNNHYYYESSIPNFSLERARGYLRKDLEAAFGMTASIEYRPVNCLIVKRTDSTEKLLWAKNQKEFTSAELHAGIREANEVGEHGVIFKNACFEKLLTLLSLSNRMMDDPIVVDETGYTNNELREKEIRDGLYNIRMRATAENVPLLKKELAKYGLAIVEDTRVVQVMVLEKVVE